MHNKRIDQLAELRTQAHDYAANILRSPHRADDGWLHAVLRNAWISGYVACLAERHHAKNKKV